MSDLLLKFGVGVVVMLVAMALSGVVGVPLFARIEGNRPGKLADRVFAHFFGLVVICAVVALAMVAIQVGGATISWLVGLL